MRKKTKKKVKWKKILIFLLILVIIFLLIMGYRSLRVKNIYVVGNKMLSEQTIIELVSLEDYPYLYQVSRYKMQKKLLTSPFIEKASIKKSLFGKITIMIDEYKVLCKDSINNQLILSNGKQIFYEEDILGVPILTNQVVPDINDKFIKALKKIEIDILWRISEITYDPNELDNERFLLYMTDQNYVYITLSKIDVLNTYDEIVPTLEGKKGILYLDSGNHFQIKK